MERLSSVEKATYFFGGGGGLGSLVAFRPFNISGFRLGDWKAKVRMEQKVPIDMEVEMTYIGCMEPLDSQRRTLSWIPPEALAIDCTDTVITGVCRLYGCLGLFGRRSRGATASPWVERVQIRFLRLLVWRRLCHGAGS